MENTKANTVLNYCNDVFFKYTLSREDEALCTPATPLLNVLPELR